MLIRITLAEIAARRSFFSENDLQPIYLLSTINRSNHIFHKWAIWKFRYNLPNILKKRLSAYKFKLFPNTQFLHYLPVNTLWQFTKLNIKS